MSPIVGIGEVLWDIYADGRKVAGGAPFNFAFHCHQLGHEAVIVSRVGDDDLGRELREEVQRLGLTDDFIQTDREHPTGTVMVTLDENKVPTYAITEDVAWDYIEFELRLSVLAQFAEAVSFGSLAQRTAQTADAIYEFLTWTTGRPRVFDINIRHRRINGVWQQFGIKAGLNRAEWFKLNEEELIQCLRADGQMPTDRRPGAADLWRLLWGCPKTVLVTRGSGGCEVWTGVPGQESWLEPGVPARVIDTVGAGDAFTAAMVCLHLEGRALRDCARFANHYAARVCEYQGATPRIDRGEIERAAFGTGS